MIQSLKVYNTHTKKVHNRSINTVIQFFLILFLYFFSVLVMFQSVVLFGFCLSFCWFCISGLLRPLDSFQVVVILCHRFFCVDPVLFNLILFFFSVLVMSLRFVPRKSGPLFLIDLALVFLLFLVFFFSKRLIGLSSSFGSLYSTFLSG